MHPTPEQNATQTKPAEQPATPQTAEQMVADIVSNPAVMATPANDFEDEELTLPEEGPSLNRMGMDTIACVGCQ